MKKLRLIIIAFFVLLPAISRAADDNYGYPIPGSYAATILGTPDQLKAELPKEIPLKKLVLDIILDLKKPDVFFYNKGLRFSTAFQKQKAPLVFLIPGTGSSDMTPRLLPLIKVLYKSGYHVITLPNPTHPNFIVSGSQSHVPGDLTEDSADIYRAMESVWNEVKGDIEVSDFFLCGYSLGGTQAAFVAKLDEERKIFNFRKVLMINPAVSLYNSVSRIEGLLDKIPGGPRKVGVFFNTMLAKFTEFYHEGEFVDIDDKFLFEVYKAHLLSNDEAGGLIGLAFRINSAGMIFVSDIMTNSGYVVPKNKVLENSDPVHDYFWVCLHLSYIDYFNEYFYPYFLKKRPGLTKEALIDSESLKSIEGYLKSSSKFGVMTNENDFILAPGELDYLRRLFGERTKVYPRGGHLGNMEFRDNMAYLVDFVGFFKK
jgi:pimeloyl-ACP methyl ester carboxylesterase